jgi:hypothetical protein
LTFLSGYGNLTDTTHVFQPPCSTTFWNVSEAILSSINFVLLLSMVLA